MLHPRPHLGAAVVAVALLAAGCGSSSDGGTVAPAASAPAAAVKAATPTTPATPAPAATAKPAAATGPAPTRADYIRRADRVCLLARGVSRRANEVVTKAFSAGQTEQAANAITTYMPLFTQHLQELKALRRPKGSQEILDALIKVMDGQVQALADESTALRQQDTTSMQQITKAQQQEVQFAEDLGKQYGFEVCGRSSAAAATAATQG